MCSTAHQVGPKKKFCILLLVRRGWAAQGPRLQGPKGPRAQGPCDLDCGISASSLVPSLKRFARVQLGFSGRPHAHLGHFEVKRRPRVGPPVNAPSPHRTAFRPHPQIPSVQIGVAAVIEPPAACQKGVGGRAR